MITALVIGVAALWLPLERHLKMEERLEEIRMKHLKMDKLIDLMK